MADAIVAMVRWDYDRLSEEAFAQKYRRWGKPGKPYTKASFAALDPDYLTTHDPHFTPDSEEFAFVMPAGKASGTLAQPEPEAEIPDVLDDMDRVYLAGHNGSRRPAQDGAQ